MMWTWEMCKNNFKGISDSACSPPGPCRWDWFLSLPSAWFHIVTDVQFSRGSISAFRQVRARHGAARGGGGGGTKTKSHEELERGNTAKFTSGCGGWRVALGCLTRLNWSSAPHLWEDKALHISCSCVGKCSFESYEENSSFNSNFLPFTEYPEMCQVMSILWGVFEQKGDLG